MQLAVSPRPLGRDALSDEELVPLARVGDEPVLVPDDDDDDDDAN